MNAVLSRFKCKPLQLDRLSGTRIKTNIKTGNIQHSSGFGIIDKWEVIEKSENDHQMVAVKITISDWLYNAILAEEVLTISDDYFLLRKPLSRRLYEIARKHVGKQKEWKINLKSLRDKCGSVRELRKFRADIKDLEGNENLPDYMFSLDEEDNVIFAAKNT